MLYSVKCSPSSIIKWTFIFSLYVFSLPFTPDFSITSSKLSLDDVMEKSGVKGNENTYKLKMKVHFMIDDGEHLTEYSIKQLDQVANILKNDPKFKLKL